MDKLERILACVDEILLARKLQSPGNWSKLRWEMDQPELLHDILDEVA